MSFVDQGGATNNFAAQSEQNNNFSENDGQLPARSGVNYRNAFNYRASIVYRPNSTEAYVEQISSIKNFTDRL